MARGDTIWHDMNWDNKFMGTMTLRKRLEKSRNSIAVKVGQCEVHSACIQDRNGAKYVLAKAKAKYPTIVDFFAHGGYAGALQI